jgi:hypothetical protein
MDKPVTPPLQDRGSFTKTRCPFWMTYSIRFRMNPITANLCLFSFRKKRSSLHFRQVKLTPISSPYEKNQLHKFGKQSLLNCLYYQSNQVIVFFFKKRCPNDATNFQKAITFGADIVLELRIIYFWNDWNVRSGKSNFDKSIG